MRRFETTARTYAARREPYPPEFFAAAADALKLRGNESLIDLGTGPGLLAIGFARYVGRVLGVDPEPAMAAEARRAAVAANVTLPVIEGQAEELDIRLGPFDLIAIGRALHWMNREATLAVIDRILASGGRTLICGSTSVAGDSNPWRVAYDAVLGSWGAARDGGHRQVYEYWFDGSHFAQIAEIKVAHPQITTPEALVERALTRSTSSPAILGSRTEAFRAELLKALAPYFPDSSGPEIIEAKVAVFAAA